jgi:2'-5' RNA ligase
MTTRNNSAGDYRIFVGAFPTGELAERIQVTRQRHDAKTARITAPHVTVAGTYWRNGPATPDNELEAITHLQAIENRLKPFELVIGGVESFLPFNNVIYLRIERTAGLLAARRVLLDALGPDKERRYTPHLTLTMRLDKGETQARLKELRQSEWQSGHWVVPLDHLWLMQRGPDDRAWRYIYRVSLSGASTAS